MPSSLTWRHWAQRALGACACLLLLLKLQAVLPAAVNGYINDIIILAGINIILGVSLNLINGVTGQFSLGHAGFMAAGAYSAAAFTLYAGPRLALPEIAIFALAVLIAAATAGLAGVLVGLPSLRLRGDYLAIVTLGFGQIIIAIIITIKELGEARALSGLHHLTTFAWTYGLVVLCLLSVRNLADSSLGRSMRAIREDEVAAEAVGVNTTRVKVLAFVISSMWAGVAGALQAHYAGAAYPTAFTFQRSVDVVVMVVLGGLGSITGATLAAVILKVLEEVLRTVSGALWVGCGLTAFAAALSLPRYREALRRGLTGWVDWLKWPVLCLLGVLAGFHYGGTYLQENVNALRYVIYSLILIVLMLLRPQGLLGRSELSWELLRRLLPGQTAAATPALAGAAIADTNVAQHEPADEGVEGTL